MGPLLFVVRPASYGVHRQNGFLPVVQKVARVTKKTADFTIA